MAHLRSHSKSKLGLKHTLRVIIAPRYLEKGEKEVVLNELEINTSDKEERPRSS